MIVEYANQLTVLIILSVGIPILIFSKSPRILNTLPAFSTGIGVLFTFAVLYYKLTDENLKIDEISKVEELVSDLAKAFSTSLFGVIGSIIFSFATKVRLDSMEKGQGLNEHPARILKDLIIKTEENTQEIGKLTGVVDGMIEQFKNNIHTLFKDLEVNLGALVESLSGEATQAFKGEIQQSSEKIVAKYNEVVENGTSETLKLLKEQSESLEKSFQLLGDLQVRSTTALESSSSTFGNAVAQYHELQQETHALIQKITSQQELLEKLALDTNKLFEIINGRSEGIEELQIKVNDISNTIIQLDALREKLEELHLKV
ncbi:MAG: hypothetical protein DHS20C18_21710 [Saprospiraceae bacterium]|nr:MAG: hypothetical protein DHS20C18_21710 [Saprospiraceae bacterium]